MNRESPGNTLADRERYKAMRHETPEQHLDRLNKELADLQSPDRYKGYTQTERDRYIAGHKTLIASIEKRMKGDK